MTGDWGGEGKSARTVCDKDGGGHGCGDWGKDKLLQVKGARESCLKQYNHLLI